MEDVTIVDRRPAAFLSYVRSDDEHESGRITQLRTRLEGEVKLQTGDEFHIFQDRNDIRWGHEWKQRIDDALLVTTFLIPVVTPTYFKSLACRSEFHTFINREKTLGLRRLILPIYYVSADAVDKSDDDEIAAEIKTRNWQDWRELRFRDLKESEIARAIASLATEIKLGIAELKTNVIEPSAAAPRLPATTTATVPSASSSGHYSLTAEIEGIRDHRVGQVPDDRPEGYYAYTKQFDETIRPTELADLSEIARLHKKLSKLVKPALKRHGKNVPEIAAELSDSGFSSDHVVSILLDNSGSMRGETAANLATWSLIIAEVLDSLGVRNEVLGFTTRAWKGGRARELWLNDGKPKKPGRLNELRHIIYKSYSESMLEAAQNFGIMLREGLFKENIDGEALLWAYNRLKAQPKGKKVLIVVSDGAPVDDSTMEENSLRYLSDHLFNVVRSIEKVSDVKLSAVGVKHDPFYYSQNVTALIDDDLGEALVASLRLIGAPPNIQRSE